MNEQKKQTTKTIQSQPTNGSIKGLLLNMIKYAWNAEKLIPPYSDDCLESKKMFPFRGVKY